MLKKHHRNFGVGASSLVTLSNFCKIFWQNWNFEAWCLEGNDQTNSL
jgi:hypothetical protein